MKNKKGSTSRWLREHFNDKYVKEAHRNRLRSRAWFKLKAIQKSDNLFHTGMRVVDLGASPGSWSQYVMTQIGKEGRVIASDMIPMDPIVGVEFLQGDIREEITLQTLLQKVGKAQVVLSDMAPNLSGIPEIDIPKSMQLIKLALDVCQSILGPGGSFLVKVFQGENVNECLQHVCALFKKIKIRKPDASHERSREVYIVATGHIKKRNTLLR